jgi:hypothetical protein
MLSTAKIQDNAVMSAKIVDGAVATADLAGNSVSTAKLQDGAITSTKIADGSVATVDVADGSIAAAKIPVGEVVKSVNGLNDAVTLAGDATITVTPSGNTLTFSATAAGGGNTLDQAYDEGGVGAGRAVTADAGAVQVDGTDGFVVTGVQGIGALAASGAGTRMMFYPNKAAFRAGAVTGTQWDNGSIGNTSTVGGGLDNRASGSHSTVGGGSSNVSSNTQTTVSGGTNNQATATSATIGGWRQQHGQ